MIATPELQNSCASEIPGKCLPPDLTKKCVQQILEIAFAEVGHTG